jgi:CheY-like chemotaxis protein
MQLILLVDGDADSLRALCEVLEFEGFDCATATTGVEGLRALARRRPALVVADEMLFDMDAVDFLMAKAALPSIAAIPVIVTTASPRLRMLSGAAALLEKPYGIDDILRLIRKHLPPTDHARVAE